MASLKSKPLNQVRSLPVDVITEEKPVRINFIVPESLRHQWKQLALDRKMTLTEVIIDAMKIYSDTSMNK